MQTWNPCKILAANRKRFSSAAAPLELFKKIATCAYPCPVRRERTSPPPDISETTWPICKIQTAINSLQWDLPYDLILLTSMQPMASQVRSKFRVCPVCRHSGEHAILAVKRQNFRKPFRRVRQGHHILNKVIDARSGHLGQVTKGTISTSLYRDRLIHVQRSPLHSKQARS